MEVPRAARFAAPLLLVALASLRAQGPPAAAPAQATDARFERVAEAVQAKMKELGVPGVALGVLNDGADGPYKSLWRDQRRPSAARHRRHAFPNRFHQ